MGDGAYLAVDIGGTKIEAGIVSDSRQLLVRRRVPTPSFDVWSAVSRVATECLEWARSSSIDVASCGVGCGGPMDLASRTVSPLHIDEWRDFDLVHAVRSVTGLPVVVDNDAKALAMAEWWHRTVSTAPPPRALMSVVLGTGVGAGIVVDGRLLHGRTGNAGHIGHIIVEPDGPRCECGALGCLEVVASGRALARATGGRPETATSFLRAEIARWLGIAVASVAATVDLTDVTLGGSVALGFGEEFCAQTEAFAREYAGLSMIADVTVRLVSDGERAPLLGAAALAKYPSPYEPDVFGGSGTVS